MTFHIEFAYEAGEREKLLHFLAAGSLTTDGAIKVTGTWVAIETGRGYALIDTNDSNALYQLCSAWSDYGEIVVTPVIAASKLA